QQGGLRLRSDAPRRDVHDARQRDRVLWVAQKAQICEDVLDLAPLVERDAADDLVREAELAERIFDRARLGVSAIEDRDVARSGRLSLSPQALDLARDLLGLVVLVIGLDDDDVLATGPIGP